MALGEPPGIADGRVRLRRWSYAEADARTIVAMRQPRNAADHGKPELVFRQHVVR
ncbi:hypothetical protein MLP_00490 [Microlunatus phosphovorus NM-1]|uniref:Uncharacterized protein n=1 Tax=Microlunatus phosphovorus (strain ATCC 700054 / DSM 10555 / JCM 9379 / NBRC 101784 / NCIMB 13414 / VKM Ac-1990 / NM-1) TaxID=1032480 RepID=F5XGF6_MICPN|nr:hypothetical protein MLP_00490 [Microlunatus phosphovorus NM-1]